ncbi:MraY family glycosyltransferase [Sphingobacterium paludis]|uniref:UDP-N-acetylmuramyl pentapeptide phosphotransferase/UDP-N-acetylglucosamine-1-phosphate transferase n=1 Tax=Sphingobacterium paludis TaxID=1476465 RepID=A0A4R7D0E9_9SPHI|nr:MraY family glycosyltransferase [Sphingobacterium paludis]TDS13777.1 UDP-N-acetylmuramyl pentapeptide phosphotransferase/UDP-N-acetylglucosamine-1-phosphate transferase [Sphingobacterium paludis]
MKILFILAPFFIALYLGRIILPYVFLVCFKKRLFDPIDKRKLHAQFIPRLGGVTFAPVQCFLMTFAVVVFYKYNFVDLSVNTQEVLPMFLLLICGLVMLFLVGIGDDLVGVSYKWKFAVQLFVAALFPLSGLWINDLYGVFFITAIPAYVGMPLTMLVVILIINAVNLIDGLDGLCSGLIAVGCMVLGVMFAVQGACLHAMFAFITAGVLTPFFYFNVFGIKKRRRRIFMGDTGSLTLGLSIAFLAISFAMNNAGIKPFYEGAIVAAFSVLIVPVMDVLRVMWVRKRAGKPLFQPDRNHIHHKLLDLGLSHRTAMMSILALATFFAVFNSVMVNYISNNIVLLWDLIFWSSFHMVLNKVESIRTMRAVQELMSAENKLENTENKKLNLQDVSLKNLQLENVR